MKIIKIKETNYCITIRFNSVTYPITKQAYFEYALFDGKEIDEKAFEEIKNRDTHIRCYDYLTKLLSLSLQSELAIKVKAINKGYKEEIVDEQINKLKQYGYINDINNIRELISLYISYNKSNNEIAFNLINKGYKEDDVISCLNDSPGEEDRIKSLYEYYEKKYQDTISSKDIKIKVVNNLINKGFDYSEINKVVCLSDKEDF